ncbi:MAG: cytochrome C oxidase subunit IV family protein [Cytophagaceae bacterium]|jgi:cytochrome c oxidase subunit IV|nr:cytochrome C oxidase subunit IV family protein [Cytophagaceae bacterium]
MGQAHNSHVSTPTVQPRDPEKIKKILKVTLYLAVATAIEFVLAFTVPRGYLLTSIFVLLTFYKSFYIVGEFMHLAHEVKLLIWAVVAPILFIIWLILAMLIEGNYVLESLKAIFG